MLRRCFDSVRLMVCGAALLVLSGCSMSGMMPAASADTAAVPVPAAVQRDYDRAIVMMTAGDAASAEAQLLRFVERHPGYANAHVNLAILQEQRGDADGATQQLRHAVELDPANAVAWNRLGVVARQQGDLYVAEQAWLEATRVAPAYPNAWHNLGVLYDIYLGDLEAAVAHYQRYQELTGADAPGADTARWIADLQRRIDAAQKTANATEDLL